MENVSLLYSCFLCVVLCHGKSISHSPQGISYNGHLASGFSKISLKPPNRMVHELYELRTFKVVVVDNIVFDHSSCFPPSFKNDAGVVCRQNEPAVIVWSYLCVCVCVCKVLFVCSATTLKCFFFVGWEWQLLQRAHRRSRIWKREHKTCPCVFKSTKAEEMQLWPSLARSTTSTTTTCTTICVPLLCWSLHLKTINMNVLFDYRYKCIRRLQNVVMKSDSSSFLVSIPRHR